MNRRINTTDLDYILDNLKDQIFSFKDKTVFITGGTGFFGKWLLETFIRANKKYKLNTLIIVLTRDIHKFLNENPHYSEYRFIQYLEGDIRNIRNFSLSFDFLIHAAADSDAKIYKEDPLQMYDVILHGTRNILDLAVNCNCKNVLFISSGAIYGKQPFEINFLLENYYGGPDVASSDSVYAETKRCSELLCTLYSSKYQINIKIARCFAFIGPFLPLDKHFAIGNFIRNALEGRPIEIRGDGTALRSYMYAADLVIWLLIILLKGKNCNPYNVGSEHAISIAELARVVNSVVDNKLDIHVLGEKEFCGKVDKYIPSVKKAREELGLEQKIDLQSAIKKTIEFYKNF